MADLHLTDSIQLFDCCVILDYKQNKPDVQGFEHAACELNEVRVMMNEMIEIVEAREDLSSGFRIAINKYISDFNERANSLILYKTGSGNNFNMGNNVIADINNWINAIYTGSDNNNKPYGFMVLYNALKLNQLVYLQKNRSLIEQIKAEVKQSKHKAAELFNLLQPQVNPSVLDPTLLRNHILNNMHPHKKESGFVVAFLQFIITLFIFVFIIYFLWVYFY